MKKNRINNKKNENLVKTINKNIRSSTRKLTVILKGIVGKKIGLALRDLTFSNKRISNEIKKTISSAIESNAMDFYNVFSDISDQIASNPLIDFSHTVIDDNSVDCTLFTYEACKANSNCYWDTTEINFDVNDDGQLDDASTILSSLTSGYHCYNESSFSNIICDELNDLNIILRS